MIKLTRHEVKCLGKCKFTKGAIKHKIKTLSKSIIHLGKWEFAVEINKRYRNIISYLPWI